jgi:hypothetical protein
VFEFIEIMVWIGIRANCLFLIAELVGIVTCSIRSFTIQRLTTSTSRFLIGQLSPKSYLSYTSSSHGVVNYLKNLSRNFSSKYMSNDSKVWCFYTVDIEYTHILFSHIASRMKKLNFWLRFYWFPYLKNSAFLSDCCFDYTLIQMQSFFMKWKV